MIRNLLVLFFGIFSLFVNGQTGLYINGSAAVLKVDAGNFISVDGDFVNQNCDPVQKVVFNGSLFLTKNLVNNDSLIFNPSSSSTKKQCRLILLGNTTCTISGNAVPQFWEVEMNKGTGNRVDLFTDIICRDTLDFKSGIIYMDNHKWILKDPVGVNITNHPWLKNERNGAQFLGASALDTGKVIYQTIYTTSLGLNPGNIGLQINGLVNVGSPVKFVRGFNNQLNAGKGSLAKYFDVYSSGHKLVNNTLTATLFQNESAGFPFNYLNLPDIRAYLSPLIDFNYTPISSNFIGTPLSLNNVNTTMTVNLIEMRHPNMRADSNSFRITFADPNCLNPPISLLGSDTAYICNADSLLLDAGNATSFTTTSLRYEWATVSPIYTRTLQVKPTASFQKFKVSLMDIRGCRIFDSVTVAPTAPFPQIKYFNHLNACNGDSITIKDTVSITSGSYSNNYFFSDNSNSQTNSQLFKKKLVNPGTYSVQLTTTSNHGCATIATRTNLVTYPNPSVSFSTSMNCLTRQVSFVNQSSSNYTSTPLVTYFWQMGGISTSTFVNPIQTFSSSGTYSIGLRVISAAGCKDSLIQNLTIYPNNSANFTKSNVCFGDTILFSNTSSCLTGSCTLNWKFGNNTSDTSQTVKKSFGNVGMYLTKLIITAPVGCPDSISMPVFVHPNPVAAFSTNSLVYCPNETVFTSNSSSISLGNIIQTNWSVGSSTLSNGWNCATQFPYSGLFQISLEAVSDSGCTTNAVTTVTVNPKPQSLLIVSNVCSGDSSFFYSAIQNPSWQYIYDPGNSSPPINSTTPQLKYLYVQSGVYSPQLITINTYGCSDTIVATHTVFPSPISPFPSTISTCGDAYVLDALNPASSFFWTPSNITTQTLNCTNSGLYQVSITATNGCQVSDQVYLQLNSNVIPQLGQDTIVCGNLVLNAGYPGSVFSWNTGQTSGIITVTTSGNYIVTVTDQNNCQGSDTINVQTKLKPTINLGADQTVCKPKNGLNLQLTASSGNYLWNTGATSTNITVSNAGYYWATVSAANGCLNSDTVKVVFLSTPLVSLGGSKTGCDQIVLDAFNLGKQYQWSNGAVTQTATISSSGKIWVLVVDPQSFCSAADTAFVQIEKRPHPNLGPDTTLCSNQTYLLKSSTINGTVLWNSGETSSNLLVKTPGIYGVVVTGSLGCMGSDVVKIDFKNAPVVDLGPQTQYLCGDAPLVINTSAFGNYLWTKNNQTVGTTSVITITEADKFKLQVSQNGCMGTDSLQVVRSTNTVQAQFLASTIDTINTSVQFVNLSQPLTITSKWTFGDGTESSQQDPQHTWLSPQNFNVSLEVTNGFCSDRIRKSLTVIFKEHLHSLVIDPSLQLSECVLFPNPSSDEFKIMGDFNHFTDCKILLTDMTGKVLQEKTLGTILHLEQQFNVKSLANALYLVRIEAVSVFGLVNKTYKFIKQQ